MDAGDRFHAVFEESDDYRSLRDRVMPVVRGSCTKKWSDLCQWGMILGTGIGARAPDHSIMLDSRWEPCLRSSYDGKPSNGRGST